MAARTPPAWSPEQQATFTLVMSVSRAGDRLFRAQGEFAADGDWVAASEQPGTAAAVAGVQVATAGQHPERGGAIGAGEPHDAVAGRAAGAVDHGAATIPGQLRQDVAEVAVTLAVLALYEVKVTCQGRSVALRVKGRPKGPLPWVEPPEVMAPIPVPDSPPSPLSLPLKCEDVQERVPARLGRAEFPSQHED